MSAFNALFEQDSSIFRRTSHTLANQYDTVCECGHCQWTDEVDLHDVDFFSLQQLIPNMTCPICDQQQLTLKLSSKA